MRTRILPIFIPHKGCPHDCVFCNQKRISGCREAPSVQQVQAMLDTFLEDAEPGQPLEIAFYGGSFTGIPLTEQRAYLEAANALRQHCAISIRASTRPDYLSEEVLALLKEQRVDLIELGVQSMQDGVLHAAGRGHTAADVRRGVTALKAMGIQVGIQTMPGLPESDGEEALDTAMQVIALQPALVRIYPTLVIRDTALLDLYQSGAYTPLSLEEAVDLCAVLLNLYDTAGIPVIRVGLQASEQIQFGYAGGDVAAGPFHPAFRQLVNSKRAYDFMTDILKGTGTKNQGDLQMEIDRTRGILYVTSQRFSVSDLMGQKRSNAERMMQDYGLRLQVRQPV